MQSDFIILYAMSLIASEKMEKAIHILTRAMNDYPDNCQIYYYRAFAQYKISNLPKAFEDCQKSIQLKEGFYASHLLLGLIMYERNNDRNALSPLLYALFLSSKAEWAEKTLFIIHSLLNQKHERIVIPIHEERFRIKNIEELLIVYTSGYRLSEWNPIANFFLAFIGDYIKDNLKNLNSLDHCYADFFNKLSQSPHMATYCYVIMQNLKLKEVDEWYVDHSKELSDYADWIEKNYQ